MTKEQLIRKVGKNDFLADEIMLSGKLTYIGGIPSFDGYLGGMTLKQINAVIHMKKHPKGLAIKIVKNFSSFPFGLEYAEIKKTIIIKKTDTSELIFETTTGRISFSLKSSYVSEVQEFLDETNLKYEVEKIKIVNKQNQAKVEVDKNPITVYINVVSALLIVIGCFMPWEQLGIIIQIKGIDKPHGAIMLISSIISGAVAIFNLSIKENKNSWIFTVVGIIGVIILFYDISEANSKANELKEGINELIKLKKDNNVSILNYVGSGFYLVFLGSIGLILSGLGFFKNNIINNQE